MNGQSDEHLECEWRIDVYFDIKRSIFALMEYSIIRFNVVFSFHALRKFNVEQFMFLRAYFNLLQQ